MFSRRAIFRSGIERHGHADLSGEGESAQSATAMKAVAFERE